MTVKEFVEQYKKKNTDIARERFIKDNLIYKKYLSFNEKVQFCSKIVETTTYEINRDKDDKILNKKIQINSPARFLFSTMQLIYSYTNLEGSMKDALENFDVLDELGLIEIIISGIPEKERNEFETILNMTMDDFIQNNMNIYSVLSSQTERLTDLINATTLPALSAFLDNMDDDKVDKITKFVKKIIKK